VDLCIDRALRQTIASPHFSIQPDVPLSLLPDITPDLVQVLRQHGAILQLPPKPYFTDIQVATKTISLKWEVQNQNAGISSDRTLTFSLHCYGDIPYKLEKKLTFKRKLRRLMTPESGFEDMSDMGSESRSTFPSLPPSLLGSRSISTHHEYGTGKVVEGIENPPNPIIREESEDHESVSDKTLPPLLPEPIRLPKRKDEAKLPQLAGLASANGSLNAPKLSQLTKDPNTTNSVGSGILNLPPLIVNINKPEPLQLVSMQSMTTSGVFDEEGNSSHRSTQEDSDQRRQESSSSMSELSNEVKVNEYTELGRFCQGYAFDEIYCGEDSSFQYSGLVAGASYFFRVRCHNAAGWGPWSDAVKCMTTFS
jgi:hypothetical protein